MKRLNVKKTYIFSYVAVILSILFVAGAALIGYGMNALKETMTRAQLERARLAAVDLETQLDSYRQVRNRIKANRVFQPSYQRRFYTRRLELIDAFSGYESDLLTDAQLYLLYGSDETIYFGRTCANWETLCRLYWNIQPDAALHAQLVEETDALLRPDVLGGDLLLTLPFELGSSGERQHMCLFIRISQKVIGERLARVSGLVPGEFSAAVDGRLVLGEEELKWRTVESEEGRVTIGLSGISGAAYAQLGRTQAVLLWLCVCFFAIGIGAAVWMAIRQYRPIADIHRKLGGGKDGNELAFIDRAISDALRENDRAKRDIVNQMDSLITQSEVIEHQASQLRRQLVLLLLLGVYRTEREVPGELLMTFRKPKFAVLTLHGDEGCMDIREVEACESERWRLFAVPIARQTRLAVLANLTDHDDLFDLVTLLGRRLGGGVTISAGGVVDLMQVSVSFVQCSNDARVLEKGDADDFLLGAECRELFTAIRSGSAESARACADALNAALPKGMATLELRRAYFALLKKLRNLADEIGGVIDESHATALMLSLTPQQFAESLTSCVADLMEREEGAEHGGEDSEDRRLVEYLDRHACEPDMSLSKMEEEFGVAPKRITAIIKRETGMGFREYVVYQRIERAKLLLMNTRLSITAIAEMCGYDNPSYFIRSFKSVTDMTPGQYQRDGE